MATGTYPCFSSPVRLTFGRGCSPGVAAALREAGARRPLVVADPGVAAAGLLPPLLAALENAGLAPQRFTHVVPNPDIACVMAAAQVGRAAECDGVLAVGGGSAMDTAKVAGALLRYGGTPLDYDGVEHIPGPLPPFVCVPTTCGTGSEVTANAVITDLERRFKFTIRSEHLLPRAAFLDPALLDSLPTTIVAATGMDALTHAIEAFTNRTWQPFADALAREAMRLIVAHARDAVRGDPDGRAVLLLASTLAGIALSHCGQGLVHAMSAPLGGWFGVPHGVANAVLLPYVTEYNWVSVPERYAEIDALLEGADSSPGPGGESSGAQRSAVALRRLNRDLGIPEGLAGLGVTEAPLERLVEDTFRSRNIPLNPRPPERAAVGEIFRRAIRGAPLDT
ncbi:MAG: iron-containing alcohol dehydrogenase [Armatimonadetes bacterium]|nr:iron-containing alcohol dehydrogenase [Armatimonadota bacterium]